MAQFLFPSIFATAIAAGAVVMVDKSNEYNHIKTSKDFMFMETAPVSSDWVFSNEADKTLCIVSKVRRVTASTSIVEADPTCMAVFPDMDLVSVWQQDKDGFVTLADEHGIPIAEFSWDRKTQFKSITGEPGKYVMTPSS